jgi:hypothetical protein
MERRLLLAAAAMLFAVPALADDNCLGDAHSQQCDVFLEQYRAEETPVGTTDMWASEPFVMEDFPELRGGTNSPAGDDVLYWDGETAMVVPEDSGPQVKIADW